MQSTALIAFDQHAAMTVAAVLSPSQRTPALQSMTSDSATIVRFMERLRRQRAVRCCYEAGPCGFELQRALTAHEVPCDVIAPALIPRRAGDRVKTDRRDAAQLAILYRAGALTPIHIPTDQEEAARDLLRCREDIRADLLRARHRLAKFLLRHGRRFTGTKNAWSKAHDAWLRGQRWPVGCKNPVRLRTPRRVITRSDLYQVVARISRSLRRPTPQERRLGVVTIRADETAARNSQAADRIVRCRRSREQSKLEGVLSRDTVLAWHRRGFRLLWTWKNRHRPGRPAVPPEVRGLIRTMSSANPLWGAPRIHGELVKLGIDVSQATVAKYIARRHRPPNPRHGGHSIANKMITSVTYLSIELLS
jgi:hypothetical protein